ncbi:hypothetical protein ABTC76_19700, partial [Acinetobacter baumannii]
HPLRSHRGGLTVPFGLARGTQCHPGGSHPRLGGGSDGGRADRAGSGGGPRLAKDRQPAGYGGGGPRGVGG